MEEEDISNSELYNKLQLVIQKYVIQWITQVEVGDLSEYVDIKFRIVFSHTKHALNTVTLNVDRTTV